MIDVKETLNEAEERMEMAAMYLDEQLQRIRAGRAKRGNSRWNKSKFIRFNGTTQSSCQCNSARPTYNCY